MNEHLNILIVDDEETLLNIFQGYLSSITNHSVFTARDGHEALEIIKRERIDCCFTDLSMPNMDGIELSERIHLFDNTIPVVIMTGYPSMENAITTLKNGVVDFLTKPFKMEQIPFIIERIMRERCLFVDNILLKEQINKNKQLTKINQELYEKTKELETVNLILQRLDQTTTSQDLFNVLVNLSGEITGCDEAHFCLISHQIKDYAIITSFFRDKESKGSKVGSIEKSIIQKVTEDGIPLLMKGNNGSGSIIAVPLKIRSQLFGILISLCHNGRCEFGERDLYFLQFLAEKASFSIENLALYENIYQNLFSTLYAFVQTIEARDPYTRQHSARVTGYAISIAKAMACSPEDIEILNVAGNLHDIGKIGIPDKILLKPRRLSDSEYEIIKNHPIIGSNIINHFNMWTHEQDVIKHHHERWDGKGYPDGLKGKEIPSLSRILSVADVYDALASDRSYRKKLPKHVVACIIKENSGSQFDPEIVDVFAELHKNGKTYL